ncbi:MAG: AAA family ATPase, partial [Chloroflexi bacterium]|nr:AAA family ATPase [Chloroflexota bacterium]
AAPGGPIDQIIAQLRESGGATERFAGSARGEAGTTSSDQTRGARGLDPAFIKELEAAGLIEITRRIVPGSVILIDEPEISLHPTWQRGLVAALDKIIEQYDAQVIMATHSLEIATSVMPHEVISLSELDELPLGEWKPEVELAV